MIIKCVLSFVDEIFFLDLKFGLKELFFKILCVGYCIVVYEDERKN